MEVKSIIKEIDQLSLRKRFLVMEHTLKSIKKEELKLQKKQFIEEDEESNLVIANEIALAKNWLSKEDSRWDNFL